MILYPHCIFKDLTEGRGISGVNSATVQDRYSSALAGMDLNHAKCESCGRIGDFSVHGYYRRRIVVMGEVCFVLIMRMKCLGCSGTHAILTADMIPYCRYMTHACLMVLAGGEVFLDDQERRRLRKRAERFLECCRAFGISGGISDPAAADRQTIPLFRLACFQIRRGRIFMSG